MPKEAFPGWIHPLDLLSDDAPTPSYVLSCLYGTGYDKIENIPIEIANKDSRISEITSQCQIFVIPVEEKIMGKLIWPLRSAKVAYCLKHNLECILLCGIVSEMLVLLIYEILPNDFLDKLDLKHANKKNGFKFKDYSHRNVGQNKRIKQLEIASNEDGLLEKGEEWVISLLDKLRTGLFLCDMHFVRDTRNHYIHSFELEYLSIVEDSEFVYKSTQRGLKHIFDFTYEYGGVTFPQYLDVYCKSKGIIHTTE